MTKLTNTKTTFATGSALRISTAEIDRSIQQLEDAFIEGRLDDNELEERMDKALKAKTEDDLARLLCDLERAELAKYEAHIILANSSV